MTKEVGCGGGSTGHKEQALSGCVVCVSVWSHNQHCQAEKELGLCLNMSLSHDNRHSAHASDRSPPFFFFFFFSVVSLLYNFTSRMRFRPSVCARAYAAVHAGTTHSTEMPCFVPGPNVHVERILNIMCLPRGPPTAYLVTISVTTKICFMITEEPSLCLACSFQTNQRSNKARGSN